MCMTDLFFFFFHAAKMQCTSDSQCSKYFYCTRDYQCTPKLPETARCSSGLECLSGSCSRPFVILPIGQCIPNPAVDNDPTGRLCTQSSQCNDRSHREHFHYCADFDSLPSTDSGLGLPIRSAIDVATGSPGVCLRLALLGDKCDESAQCLSGYCRLNTASSDGGGVCDFQPAPIGGDLRKLFTGEADRHTFLLLGIAFASVVLFMSAVYAGMMLIRLVRQKKRLAGVTAGSASATNAVDVYVPMRIISYAATAAGSPNNTQGEYEDYEDESDGDSGDEGTNKSMMPPPPPYQLVSDEDDDDSLSLSSSINRSAIRLDVVAESSSSDTTPASPSSLEREKLI